MTLTTFAPAPLTANPPHLGVAKFMTRDANAPNAELIDGIVKEQPLSSPGHGKVSARMTTLIHNHADANDRGHVRSNDSRVQTGPENVRGGDVLFFKSPTDTWIEIFSQVVEFLKARVRVVVVVDPGKSTVESTGATTRTSCAAATRSPCPTSCRVSPLSWQASSPEGAAPVGKSIRGIPT